VYVRFGGRASETDGSDAARRRCSTLPYIPIGQGFLYLVAIIDWASRAVLSWRLSNTMDTSFCIDALEDALARFGRPDIFNTDQGLQLISRSWVRVPARSPMKSRT